MMAPALLLAACTTVGPGTVARDRFDYSAAIRDSWKREMLQNIVNMRYGSPPVFLDVASVISQYELRGQISAGVAFNGSMSGEDVTSLGANAHYAERPTMTYQPLTGPKFAQPLSSDDTSTAFLNRFIILASCFSLASGVFWTTCLSSVFPANTSR